MGKDLGRPDRPAQPSIKLYFRQQKNASAACTPANKLDVPRIESGGKEAAASPDTDAFVESQPATSQQSLALSKLSQTISRFCTLRTTENIVSSHVQRVALQLEEDHGLSPGDWAVYFCELLESIVFAEIQRLSSLPVSRPLIHLAL